MALLPGARVTQAVPWGLGTHPLQGQDSATGCGDTPAATPSSPSHGEEGHLPLVLWTINQLKDILIYAHQIGLAGIRLISKCFSAHYFLRKIFS